MRARTHLIMSALFVLLFSAVTATGQVATGIYPYGTYDNKGFDTINVGNLNVHFALPVLNKAGRGLSFQSSLSYDSSVWYPTAVNGANAWAPAANFGWNASGTAPVGYLSFQTVETTFQVDYEGKEVNCTLFEYKNFVYYDTLGTGHPFSQTWTERGGGSSPMCRASIASGGPETASDGSGYSLTVSNYTDGAITTAGGQQITLSSSESRQADANGNYISTDGLGNYTDTTGNVVLTVSGTPPSARTFTYKDANGNSQHISVTYVNHTVQTAFGCSGIGEYGPTVTPLVDTIAYPDGSEYHFSYEGTPGASGSVTGRLSGIETPQGRWIHYTYSGGSNGIECADGSTAGLTRTLDSDSDSAASAWSYSRSTGTNTSHTEVVDGLQNHSAYDFVEASNQPSSLTAVYYETNHAAYQGAETGTPVILRHTCYNGNSSPCTATSFILPVSQIDTYEVNDGIAMHGATAHYNTYGMETEADVYDYGSSSSRGALLEKEVWTYGSNIVDLATEDEIFDGSGNPAGNTVYAYDGGSLTGSGYGVPHHNPVSCPCGNLTSMTQYAGPSTSYTSTATYEDTGSLLTVKAPNGTTTLSYDSSYVYNTGVSLPTPSSGVPLATSESFDTTDTGLPLTSTDTNAQVTSVTAYDSMLRPTQVNYPDGGVTTSSYSPTQLSQYVHQSSSAESDTETEYDGYGRISRTAVANVEGGNSWYQTDTCYDANSNTAFTSYSYQGSGFSSGKVCTGPGDSYTYDVLGRLRSATRANGESRSYSYSGRATKSVDENGVTRITQVDGLGRQVVVCEISPNASMPGNSGSPAPCGTDIAGTGFTTTFSYALATGTTTVTQGVQRRVFQTDWLGRPTSVTEPESGTTTYSYAYNSTGLQATRTRPKANQSSSSVTTATTVQYDSLGRVVSITYNDGTPTKTYTYDKSAGANFTDLSQENLKGRLSLASVASAATAYSYDAMGRVRGLDECLPSGCGTVALNRQLHYTYDLAGNLLTSTDGSNTTSTYTVSPANEVLSLTSSLSNTTNPPNVLANVQGGPNGPMNWKLGNGLSGVYGYDALGRLSGGWVCEGSTEAGCAGGTQVYGFTVSWKGSRLTGSSDSVLSQASTYGYDEFNRFASRTVNSGTVANFTYVYDRWGNRWQQNVTAGSGLNTQLAFNTATNQVSGSGYTYDAAGNMTSDGYHTYTYDAEGNITSVGSGTTAQYVYDALNHRVRAVANGATTEFVFNANGQRVSTWDGTSHVQLQGQYYWGSKPIAYHAGSAAHFQHQDWLGTERLRTTYNGGVEGAFTSLPFGDAQVKASGTDGDSYHYAMLDSDAESGTDHAQYRQYSSTQGRWLSPDLYSGSYDFSNPQSFNRYTYAENNPLANVDPSGLVTCQTCRGDLFGPGGLFYYDGSGEFAFGSGWNEFDTYSSSTYYDVYTPNGDDYLFSDGVWGGIMDGDNSGITLTGGDAGDIWAAGGATGYSVDEFSDIEMVGMALTTSSVLIGNISTRQSMSIYVSQSSVPNNNQQPSQKKSSIWVNIGGTIGCIGGMGADNAKPIEPPPGIRPMPPVQDPGLPTGSGPSGTPWDIIPYLIDVAACITNVWKN